MIVCREKHAKAVDRAVFPFTQGGPLMHAVAAKAVALREASTPDYQAYAARVVANAAALAKALEAEGQRQVSGGTGIRIGSPSVTTQGMAEPRMAEIARLIGRAVRVVPGIAAGDTELTEIAGAVENRMA